MSDDTDEICAACNGAVDEDDTVWIDPETGRATTDGFPYHVRCAPAENGGTNA